MACARLTGGARRVGQSLRPRELEALHDVIDSTNNKIRMVDFINFFCVEQERMKSFRASGSNTVTSVALSPEMRFIAFGGMDCGVAVHDLKRGGAPKFVTKCETQVGGVALARGAEFVAVGGYTGAVLWLRLRRAGAVARDVLDHDAAFLEGPLEARRPGIAPDGGGGGVPHVVYAWDHGKDVYCVCIGGCNEELAVGGADAAVTIYELRSGAKRYRFPQEATVWGVALSAMTCYTLEMEDGTRLDTVRDVKFLEQGSAGPSRTSRARVRAGSGSGTLRSLGSPSTMTSSWMRSLVSPASRAAPLPPGFLGRSTTPGARRSSGTHGVDDVTIVQLDSKADERTRFQHPDGFDVDPGADDDDGDGDGDGAGDGIDHDGDGECPPAGVRHPVPAVHGASWDDGSDDGGEGDGPPEGCERRLVMVEGVVRSSYDEVGRGDWADLDYKLDSLPTQVGILVLVGLSIALSAAATRAAGLSRLKPSRMSQ